MTAINTNWPDKHELFGVSMSATDYDQSLRAVIAAANARTGGVVTHLAVHGLVTAARDTAYRSKVNTFEAVAPDGMPVRWALDFFWKTHLPDRVYGPELMLRLCEAAAELGVGVYLYGSTTKVVTCLRNNLQTRFPAIRIVGCEPSIFRPLTPQEDLALIERINASDAGLLFLGLGCPRQEVFAFEHRRSLQAVQLCVGAAFDFHAGNTPMAPRWMQKRGLEWLYRLLSEPRRLWRRYLVTNTMFCLLVARRMLTGR